jgi:tetratricopeptide (TPR) repeat protein
MMEGPAARAELDEALRLGLEGKADLVAARAMVVRVFVLAYAEGRPSAGLAEAGLAWAMVRRVGSPPELVALLHNNLGTAAEMMGDHVRALDEYERSLALLRVHAPRGSLRWIVVNNFAEALNTAGQAERAMQIVRPVLQELSESYGPCHPIAINMYVILADSRISMARFDEAMVDIARAQACATQQDSQHRITVHLYAAMLHSLREELEQARTHVAKGQGLAVSESEVVPWLDQLELVGAEAELRSGSFDAARLLIENVEERMSATDDAFPVESLRLHLMVSLHALLTGDAQAAASRLKIVEARAGSLRLADRALFAFTLARTLHALGREPGRVRELADAAIRDYGRAGAAYGPRAAEVAAWRDGLPAP